MTILTEGRHAGEFILSEAEAGRARDNVVIASGAGILKPGTVLGKITTGGKFWPSTNASVTETAGAQTAVAVLIHAVDATSADVKAAVISRAAQVKGDALSYDASVNDATKIGAKHTQLAAVGIIVR